MKVDSDRKRITAILKKGHSLEIVRGLLEEKGLAAHVTGGRGSGRTRAGLRGYGAWMEVDILSVIVEAARADEIFEYIHEKAEIGEDGRGMLTQAAVPRSTIFELPEVPPEAGTKVHKPDTP